MVILIQSTKKKVIKKINSFELVQNDFYTIHIDPCSDKWQQVGITFFLFTYVPLPEEIRCMKAVKSIGNMYIYKREDL